MIQAKKKYGQNFLKNEEVLKRIASSIKVCDNDLIIEIGPGTGALTKHLVSLNANLICYEIDLRMKDYLARFESNKTKIIYGDFLERDMVSDIKAVNPRNVYVVANIPYYITSPILNKLIESRFPIQKIVLLVQKEFANRLVAKCKSKEYNALTLYIDYNYSAQLLFDVSRYDFVPVPNVDSAVVALTLKSDLEDLDKEFYFKFIRDAFTNKRKTLKNNLKSYEWSKILGLLNDLGYKESVRAEEISPEDFKFIVNNYKK